MAGAKLRLLHRKHAAQADQRRLELFLAAADNDHLVRRGQRLNACQQMHQHGLARNRVKHLVQIGFHPRALACSKDDGGDGSFAHTGSFATKLFRFPELAARHFVHRCRASLNGGIRIQCERT